MHGLCVFMLRVPPDLVEPGHVEAVFVVCFVFHCLSDLLVCELILVPFERSLFWRLQQDKKFFDLTIQPKAVYSHIVPTASLVFSTLYFLSRDLFFFRITKSCCFDTSMFFFFQTASNRSFWFNLPFAKNRSTSNFWESRQVGQNRILRKKMFFLTNRYNSLVKTFFAWSFRILLFEPL